MAGGITVLHNVMSEFGCLDVSCERRPNYHSIFSRIEALGKTWTVQGTLGTTILNIGILESL
jgi:hypothetical protein